MNSTYSLILHILIDGELKRYFMQVGIDDVLSDTDDELLEKVTEVARKRRPGLIKNDVKILDIDFIEGEI